MNFSEKGLSVFKYFNYLPSWKESKKICSIPEKNAKLMDKQTNKGDFIGPSVGRRSNKSRHNMQMSCNETKFKAKKILVSGNEGDEKNLHPAKLK